MKLVDSTDGNGRSMMLDAIDACAAQGGRTYVIPMEGSVRMWRTDCQPLRVDPFSGLTPSQELARDQQDQADFDVSARHQERLGWGIVLVVLALLIVHAIQKGRHP